MTDRTRHFLKSRYREKVVEHIFVGELLRYLWARGMDGVEILTPEVDASGYDILRSHLTVRVEGGLVCGIGGYPAFECAPAIQVNQPSARPAGQAVNEKPSDDSLTSFGSISLTVLVVIFGIGLAIALWWRRK